MKIGTYQLQDIQGDTAKSLGVIKNRLAAADTTGLDIVCFPECYLQGYTLDARKTARRALHLNSPPFQALLAELAPYRPTIILGLIEQNNGGYFNTAVVIQGGKVLGAYRKVHLFEQNFQPGNDYPTFSVSGTTIGINICYDARFAEGAARLAQQGAQVIFYLLNNRLPIGKANNYRAKHLPNLVARAKETGCWVISSDVVDSAEDYIGYGHTAIVRPDGIVIAEARQQVEGMLVIDLGKAKQFRVQ